MLSIESIDGLVLVSPTSTSRRVGGEKEHQLVGLGVQQVCQQGLAQGGDLRSEMNKVMRLREVRPLLGMSVDRHEGVEACVSAGSVVEAGSESES